MANKIQIRRGDRSLLPVLSNGEPGLAQDTREVFIGNNGANVQLQTLAGATDYTIYVATTALGGLSKATQGATGLLLASGTTTSTLANKLVDAGAAFTSALTNKTVYNATTDTWAKITAVDSATQLSLSADIFLTGQSYKISSALDNIPEAFSAADSGYLANITIRVSPGTFSNDLNLIGKTAGDNKTLTLQGSTTGTTTVSGKVTVRQKLTFANLTFTNWIKAYFGADITWNTCTTSGVSKLYHYDGNSNAFTSCTITFGNDPGTYTAVSSTITKGYTMYMASATLGGSDATGDGLSMYSGTATSTLANKLVDSAANFATDVVGKTLYNSTNDTWAKVTARDSATQLSISADIMTNGNAYIVASAFATVATATASIPGMVNCDTTIKVSNESHAGNIYIQGKAFSDNYKIKVLGSYANALGLTTVSSATVGSSTAHGTITVTGATWTTNAYKGKWVKFSANTTTVALRNQTYLVQSNTATVLTIVGVFAGTPVSTDTFTIEGIGTTITGEVQALLGQVAFNLERLKVTGNTYGVKSDTKSYIQATDCDFVSIWAIYGATFICNGCYIHGSGYGARNIWANVGATISTGKCLIDGENVANEKCVFVDFSSVWFNNNTTCVIQNATYGIWVETNGTTASWLPGTDTKTDIKSCTTGFRVQQGAQSNYTGATYIVFTGCTTNLSVDAASYGYAA